MILNTLANNQEFRIAPGRTGILIWKRGIGMQRVEVDPGAVAKFQAGMDRGDVPAHQSLDLRIEQWQAGPHHHSVSIILRHLDGMGMIISLSGDYFLPPVVGLHGHN